MTKIAAMKYKGLSSMAADDDSTELPECLAASVGRDSDASVDEAFEKLSGMHRKTASLLMA